MSKRYEIRVRVRPEYVAEQSEPESGRYLFAYYVLIHNAGDVAARLMHRHWLITDGNGELDEVRGDGVIGEQPLLAPDEEYQYSSFCVLGTPVGWMQGTYRMVAEDGMAFDAEIPLFKLVVPGSLN